MEGEGLPADLQRLLAHPSREAYLAVASRVFSNPSFCDASSLAIEVAKLQRRGRHEEALARIAAARPNGLLSLSLHRLAGISLRALGRVVEAALEDQLGHACVRGASCTGDGTQGSPYRVTGVSDEHDLLAYLGRASTGQSLREVEGRYFDVFTMQDGGEVWFDVEPFFIATLISRHGGVPTGFLPEGDLARLGLEHLRVPGEPGQLRHAAEGRSTPRWRVLAGVPRRTSLLRRLRRWLRLAA